MFQNNFSRVRIIALLSVALATTPAAIGQERLRKLSEDSYLNPKSWFDPVSCSGSGGGLYLAVGNTTIKVPLEIVRGIVPGKFQMTRDANGKAEFQVPRKSGCREAPISITATNLSAESGKHESIIVSHSPESRTTLESQLTKIRDGGACQTIEPGLVACEGTRPSASGAQERVAYLMASDSKLVQLSGGPLRARCIFPVGKPVCTVIDDMPGDVRYESLVAGPPTLIAITEAHKAARAYVNSLRIPAR